MATDYPVIAYDFRILTDGTESLWQKWDAERRRIFLLREDVLTPLSADAYVWPEALDSLAWQKSPPDDDSLAWRDLSVLESVKLVHARTDGVVVAITEQCPAPHRGHAVPSSPPLPATCLGFDVIDSTNMSVLMNHGWSDELEPARTAWKSRWAPHLNEHHLFNETKRAREFSRAAKLEDLLTTGGDGHGQFCVVGLLALGPLGYL